MSGYIEYTVRVYKNGNTEWWLNGELHREDGPAVECSDGTKSWYLHGKRHREDGPALVLVDGEIVVEKIEPGEPLVEALTSR